MTINIVFIVSLVAVAVLGYLLGFGRSLKVTTKGIFGILISIVACVMLGGAIKNIDAVGRLIENVDAYFAGLWNFLGKLHFGTVVYYVCFFVVVQIARIIIVKTICKIDGIKSKGVKIASKAMGAVFISAFCFGLCLLCLAGFKVFENSEFTINLLAKIEDSFLMTLYLHNPIVI